MLTEPNRQQLEWWINRFILSKYGRQWLRREHGFDPIALQPEHNRQRRRFPEYAFDFVGAGEQLLIRPKTQEAQWGEGMIYTAQDGQPRYLSGVFEIKVTIPK